MGHATGRVGEDPERHPRSSRAVRVDVSRGHDAERCRALYRADAAKDIAHIFRVRSDPWEDEHFTKRGETDWCECELIHTLKHPLQLWDMRQRPALDDWVPMQVG